ncbi:hypothetical protein BD779DRAFT_1475272 [Infundibulicybe gibba]|nr:hypothetical protein BD779DRAFT_1475272 [Infundibulicybe gibba]
MDILGTVVSAIDLVGKVIRYLQAIKGAREDRQKLLSEVSALGALLEVLRGRLCDTSADGNSDTSISDRLVMAGINRPLRMCCDALNPIVEGLERLLPDVNIGMSSTLAGKMRDLRWPFHQEQIRITLSNIEQLKSLVSLALQTSLMWVAIVNSGGESADVVGAREFIEKARDDLAIMGLTIGEIQSAVSSLEASQKGG